MIMQTDRDACPECHQNTKREKGKVHDDGDVVRREGVAKQS